MCVDSYFEEFSLTVQSKVMLDLQEKGIFYIVALSRMGCLVMA